MAYDTKPGKGRSIFVPLQAIFPAVVQVSLKTNVC